MDPVVWEDGSPFTWYDGAINIGVLLGVILLIYIVMVG